ncbi:MAG: hypothetical protein ACOX9E_00555, partial [Lentisphaeria bacterium]
MVKRLRRNMDTMDDNTRLSAVHIVHSVHSSLWEQQLSIGDRLRAQGNRSPIDNWPFSVALQWKPSFVSAMWHAFSALFRVGLPRGCAAGGTPGWYVVPIQGTPPLRDRLTPQRHMTP